MRTNIPQEHRKLQTRVKLQTALFEAKGGVIQQIPRDASGLDKNGAALNRGKMYGLENRDLERGR